MTDKDTSRTLHAHASVSDDIVLPFHAEAAGVNGRVVRLGGCIDAMLAGHDYPVPVSKLLGEAVALTAMVGSALKFDGKLILQTKSDGAVDMLVVQFTAPGYVRGYARYDEAAVKDLINGSEPASGELMGRGHLALTIDQGPDMEQYQGIVALEGNSLADVAHNYFEQSEQLPSFIRLAVAQHFDAKDGEDSDHWHWRAGGLMIQDLTKEGGRTIAVEDQLDEDELEEVDEDGWNRARVLAETVQDHELLDPMLTPEELIYRLFHEERIRVFGGRSIEARCSCSRDHIQGVLRQFSDQDIADMVKDGQIEVTCEFCSKQYHFQREEFKAG